MWRNGLGTLTLCCMQVWLAKLCQLMSCGLFLRTLLGDFAYDLHSNYGACGDNFLDSIQNVSAKAPYMTCVGNHESENNFSQYRARFSMPSPEEGPNGNMWYSFNSGPLHIIAYSTETFFTDLDGPVSTAQFNWLKVCVQPSLRYSVQQELTPRRVQNDLEQANMRRHEQPWIIAMGHRPFYCNEVDPYTCKNTSGPGTDCSCGEQYDISR